MYALRTHFVFSLLAFLLLFFQIVDQFAFGFHFGPLVSQSTNDEIFLKSEERHVEQRSVWRTQLECKAIPIRVAKTTNQ